MTFCLKITFKTKILMRLKAVTAKYEVATQLARYKDELNARREAHSNVVSPASTTPLFVSFWIALELDTAKSISASPGVCLNVTGFQSVAKRRSLPMLKCDANGTSVKTEPKRSREGVGIQVPDCP